jgi:nuclear protein localization protein 4 homolog
MVSKDGVLETEVQDADDPRLSKMRKEVVAGGKDTMKVDNDFFLVPVKISDHQVYSFTHSCSCTVEFIVHMNRGLNIT